MSRRHQRVATRLSHRSLLAAVVATALLGGCAHRGGLYAWGGYDQLLYQAYKNPGDALVAQQELQAHIASLEASHTKVPPGLYAEVGTFCLQAGDRACAARQYEKEAQAWPESRPLMTTLVAHIDRPLPPARPASAPDAAQPSAPPAGPAPAASTPSTGARP